MATLKHVLLLPFLCSPSSLFLSLSLFLGSSSFWTRNACNRPTRTCPISPALVHFTLIIWLAFCLKLSYFLPLRLTLKGPAHSASTATCAASSSAFTVPQSNASDFSIESTFWFVHFASIIHFWSHIQTTFVWFRIFVFFFFGLPEYHFPAIRFASSFFRRTLFALLLLIRLPFAWAFTRSARCTSPSTLSTSFPFLMPSSNHF